MEYPKFPISERIDIVRDLILLYQSALERFTSPNDERRSKSELGIDGRYKLTLEKEAKWQKRIEKCNDIRNNVLPQLHDTLNLLNGIEERSTTLDSNIRTITRLIEMFEASLTDKDVKLEDPTIITERTLPQLRDVLVTLNLVRYGD